MGLQIQNDVANQGYVNSIKAGTEAAMPATKKSLYIAEDTEKLYYRKRNGQSILLTGNGGGESTPPTFSNNEFSL